MELIPYAMLGFNRGDNSIMVTQLSYLEGIIGNFVNDSVFIVYAAGPIPGKRMLQRLGLADSFKGIAHYFPD
jgi:hypothetical protein